MSSLTAPRPAGGIAAPLSPASSAAAAAATAASVAVAAGTAPGAADALMSRQLPTTEAGDGSVYVPKPSLSAAANLDVKTTVEQNPRRRRRGRRAVARASSRRQSYASRRLKAVSSPTCSGHQEPGTSVFRDPSLAPVRLVLTQSVRKSNDRGKDIPAERPPLFCNDSGVHIFFAGNGLFPMFVDLVTQQGAAFDMMTASPPAVRVFSYPDSTPAKRAQEVDPHDWDMPSFQRMHSGLYVLKLGFKKAIGANRFFFLTVTLTSGGTTVKVTSPLFKVATKPRKLIIGNLAAGVTADELRRRCPDLDVVAAARTGAGADKPPLQIAGPEVDDRARDGSCVRYSILFRTPSRCLAFFATHYHTFHAMGTTFHLVPKRPCKMQPPSDLRHVAFAEMRIDSAAAHIAAASGGLISAAPATTFSASPTAATTFSASPTPAAPFTASRVPSALRVNGVGEPAHRHALPHANQRRRYRGRRRATGTASHVVSPVTPSSVVTMHGEAPLPVGLKRSSSVGLVRLPSTDSKLFVPSPAGGAVLPVGPPGDASPTAALLAPMPLSVPPAAGSTGSRSDLDSPTSAAPPQFATVEDAAAATGPGADIQLPVPGARAIMELSVPFLERGFSASSIGTLDLDMVDTSWLDEPVGPVDRLPIGDDVIATGIGCDSPLAFLPSTVVRAPAHKRKRADADGSSRAQRRRRFA